MQPTLEPLSQDIKTLADWIYEQFRATDPVEVINILDTPYHFRYCVNETIETPDQVTRRVVERQYEEKTIQPGATEILMGAAAYIFVDGVARHYLYQEVLKASTAKGLEYNKAEEQAANATADLQQLVEAAKLVIRGKVGYASSANATTAPVLPHNPTAIQDDNGMVPQQQNTVQQSPPANTTPTEPVEDEGDDDAFANLGNEGDVSDTVELLGEFKLGDDVYDVTANGRTRKNGTFVSVAEYVGAQGAYEKQA